MLTVATYLSYIARQKALSSGCRLWPESWLRGMSRSYLPLARRFRRARLWQSPPRCQSHLPMAVILSLTALLPASIGPVEMSPAQPFSAQRFREKGWSCWANCCPINLKHELAQLAGQIVEAYRVAGRPLVSA